MPNIEEQINELPPELQREVHDFIEFLLARHSHTRRQTPKFSWRGSLSNLRDQYHSVELQHQIAHWRNDFE